MLIILSKSQSARDHDSISKMAEKTAKQGEKTAILHVQDACLAATEGEYCEKLVAHKIQVYALKADCQARGLIDKINKNVELIDYEKWVKLAMTEHKNIVSWTS